jgi:hypothetical protein
MGKEIDLKARREEWSRWWGPDRNTRRRNRYADDPEYRKQAVQATRDSYRRRHPRAGGKLEGQTDCRSNLAKLSEIGQVRRVVLPSGLTKRILTFTPEEVANVVMRNVHVIYRWWTKELLPTPVLKLYGGPARCGVRNKLYTKNEMIALCKAFGPHQAQTPYYRMDHTEVRERIFEEIAAVRYRDDLV